MELMAILKKLSEISGVSGYEKKVNDYTFELFKDMVDDLCFDKLGNLIALKKGETNDNKPIKIMLSAHADEIGLMVTKIDDDGFIRFTTIGGFDPRTLISQQVRIHGKEVIEGVIGAISPHVTTAEEKEKKVEIENLFIDVGFSSNETKNKVKVGDLISIKRDFIELNEQCASGKAFDDRAGILTLYYCLCELQGIRHGADVYFVFSIQEEVGVRGAIVSTYSIEPDIGIAVDVCHGDMPGVPEHETSKIGGGSVIAIGPNIHPCISNQLKKIATEINVSYQIEPSPGPTGTDARAMQITREGIATGLVSIPLRYMHTSVELLNVNDIKSTGRLLAYFIKSIDKNFLEGLGEC